MPPLTGKPRPEPGGEIGGGEREELLVGVEPAAVLGRRTCGRWRPSPPRRAGSRRAPAAAGRSDRPTPIAGSPMAGSPCGTSPSSFTPRASRSSKAAATMPPTTTNSATGLFFRKIFPSTSSSERHPADGERGGIGLGRGAEEVPAVLPEIAVRAVNAEQLGQLRAGEEQRHAAS